MFLCLPLAVATAALSIWFYIECAERLLRLAEGCRAMFLQWACPLRGTVEKSEAWQRTLWTAVQMVLQGAGWGIFGLVMASPGVIGATLTALFLWAFRPACRRFGELRARVQGISDALKLLEPMPKDCHVFVHKRIAHDGGVSQTDLILVGPGGVALLEVRNLPGLIEGCVTDPVLRRRMPEGEVVKLRNPARQAVAHVKRLTAYLANLDLNVWIVPCVLFIHEDASAYVTVPDTLMTEGRRQRISSCVVTDAVSFWEQMGREYAAGRVLSRTMVEQVTAAIRKAPEGKRQR